MKRGASKIDVTPYSALAPIYDQVMAHVNYKRWAAYIHEIISRFRPESKWIVDISCGTGTFCSFLQRYGYSVTGMDSSLPMLKRAVQKWSPRKNIFICADFCFPPLSEQPDVIVSLYDSMNYLLERELWLKCFQNVSSVLKENGIFIFDVSTVYNSRTEFSPYTHNESFRGGSYVRKSTFDDRENIQQNYFEITLAHKPQTLFCETHRQRIRPLAEVKKIITDSPFTLLAGYKEFSFEPYSEKCERVHFILKKKSNQHVRTP